MESLQELVAAPADGSLVPLLRARWLAAIDRWLATARQDRLSDSYLQHLAEGIELVQTAVAELVTPALFEFEVEPTDVQLALALSAAGAAGDWRLDGLGDPSSAFFGPYRLDFEGEVAVERDGRAVRVRSGADGVKDQTFERQGGGWLRRGESAAPSFEVGGRTIPLLSPEDHTLGRELVGSRGLAVNRSGEAAPVFRRAAELITATAPEYAGWIAHVLRAVEVVGTDGRAVESGSHFRRPGTVYITYPIADDHLATLLVHECAHQYLHLFSLAVPLVDASDTSEYYSPFKRTNRPLFGVMLALHAAVNIRRFVGLALGARPDSGFLRQEDEDLRAATEQMLTSIGEAAGLTGAGRQVIDRLQALSR